MNDLTHHKDHTVNANNIPNLKVNIYLNLKLIKIILRLLRLTADLSNEPRKVPHKFFIYDKTFGDNARDLTINRRLDF